MASSKFDLSDGSNDSIKLDACCGEQKFNKRPSTSPALRLAIVRFRVARKILGGSTPEGNDSNPCFSSLTLSNME